MKNKIKNHIRYTRAYLNVSLAKLLGKRYMEGKIAKFNPSKEKVLFIHIPKSAGMSVVKAIYNEDFSQHAFALDYLLKDKGKFLSTYSFALTRNPYERLYSAYCYLREGGMNAIDKVWYDIYVRKYHTFESFIIDGGLEYAIIHNAEHFIPQSKFVCDGSGNIICSEVRKLEDIGGFELELSKKIGREVKIQHLNHSSSSGRENIDIYTDEMLAIVSKLYKTDFEVFSYDVACS